MTDRRLLVPTVTLALLGLAGCPSESEPSNPEILWLALDGAETRVRLVPQEPPPY